MPLKLIIGPMFAGKTTMLLNDRNSEIIRGATCIVIKSVRDVRYSVDSVVSHNQIKAPAIAVKSLKEANHIVQSVDSVFIDEAHFYADAAEVIIQWTDKSKNVFVTTLNGGEDRSEFEVVSRLIPHCDVLILLKARCDRCLQDAIFSSRKDPSTDNVVGGSETYTVLCRGCYLCQAYTSST